MQNKQHRFESNKAVSAEVLLQEWRGGHDCTLTAVCRLFWQCHSKCLQASAMAALMLRLHLGGRALQSILRHERAIHSDCEMHCRCPPLSDNVRKRLSIPHHAMQVELHTDNMEGFL